MQKCINSKLRNQQFTLFLIMINKLLISLHNLKYIITPFTNPTPHNKNKDQNIKNVIKFKEHLRSDASDWREAWIVASSYSAAEWIIGWVWAGVKNGTLFSSRGGNSTPADC